MHPALTLSGLGPVPAYELMLALGACALTAVLADSAARGALPRGRVFAWIAGTYLAALAGARVGHAASKLPDWSDVLVAVSRSDGGGFSSLGGTVAAGLCALWIARRLDLPLERLAHPLVLGGCIFGAVARVGCFLAGCCHGQPTTLPWGVVYPPGAPAAQLYGPAFAVHPSPLYEAGLLLGLAAWLAWPGTRRTVSRAAATAAAYLLGRFALDLLRGDVARHAGLTSVQWALLGGAIVAGAAVAARAISSRRRNTYAMAGVSLK